MMGTRHPKEPIRWTEALMQQKLLSFRSTPRYVLQNLFVFGWESDLLFLSKSGFWTELEIKVSRADFRADLKNKQEKHGVLADASVRMKPNQFFYAVPDGMIQPDEIPEYAGLVVVGGRYINYHMAKPAPWLHRHKIGPDELELADKFYYNMVNAKREAFESKRTAKELTDAYNQGIEQGWRTAMEKAMDIFARHCPFREPTEEGRIHCLQLDRTQFGICNRGLCRYLEEKEDEMLALIEKR